MSLVAPSLWAHPPDEFDAASSRVWTNTRTGEQVEGSFLFARSGKVAIATPSGALETVGRRTAVDVTISVDGGGPTGQAGACRLGIARALKALDGELAEPLRQGGLLTRDGRMKERKKYGLRGARRGTQFSKR